MVLCKCKNNNSTFSANNCSVCADQCDSQGYSCVDDKTLGMVTEVVITLLVLSYVFFLVLIYFVMKTLERCKGKPKWLSPLLITLSVLVLVLGWVPILNIILVIGLLVVVLHYYTSCGIKRGK